MTGTRTLAAVGDDDAFWNCHLLIPMHLNLDLKPLVVVDLPLQKVDLIIRLTETFHLG